MDPIVGLSVLTGHDLARSCVVCGSVFAVHLRERNRRRYCSESCRVSQYRDRYRDSQRERARESYVPRTPKKGVCLECGSQFEGRSNKVYCSQQCAGRAFNRRRVADGRAADLNSLRRALEAGAKVSRGRRVEILERDDWVCQLCGYPTDRSVKYPHPNFPVIDHRVPLALGGDHAPENWQTAHNRCNAAKGARLVS